MQFFCTVFRGMILRYEVVYNSFGWSCERWINTLVSLAAQEVHYVQYGDLKPFEDIRNLKFDEGYFLNWMEM